jgi:hypothetical protein
MTKDQKPTRTKLPPVEKVKDAVPEPKGTAKKCCDAQVGENRAYRNLREEKQNTEK